MIKIWVLTVIFLADGVNALSISTEQYEYQTSQSCEVWKKYWASQRKVAGVHCTQAERAK